MALTDRPAQLLFLQLPSALPLLSPCAPRLLAPCCLPWAWQVGPPHELWPSDRGPYLLPRGVQLVPGTNRRASVLPCWLPGAFSPSSALFILGQVPEKQMAACPEGPRRRWCRCWTAGGPSPPGLFTNLVSPHSEAAAAKGRGGALWQLLPRAEPGAKVPEDGEGDGGEEGQGSALAAQGLSGRSTSPVLAQYSQVTCMATGELGCPHSLQNACGLKRAVCMKLVAFGARTANWWAQDKGHGLVTRDPCNMCLQGSA